MRSHMKGARRRQRELEQQEDQAAWDALSDEQKEEAQSALDESGSALEEFDTLTAGMPQGQKDLLMQVVLFDTVLDNDGNQLKIADERYAKLREPLRKLAESHRRLGLLGTRRG